MRIQFRNITITTDKFIALLLAMAIIYYLFRKIEELIRKNIRNRKVKELLINALMILFLLIVCVFLLNYVFRWF